MKTWEKVLIIVLIVIVLAIGAAYFLPKFEKSNVGYSSEELEEMALDYYEKENNYRPSLVASEPDVDNEDLVNIQLYDNLGDHNSTSDWYTVNKYTGRGTNLSGEEIELLEE